jgi:hypothetical protein
VENNIVSGKKQNPAFDEQTLAKVLEAAYVLQEHNRKRQENDSAAEVASVQKPLKPNIAVRTQPQNGQRQSQAKLGANADFTLVLAQIVETQQQIQADDLNLENSLSLIAERAMQVAHAAGAGIGILENGKVHYYAAAGAMTLTPGSAVRMEEALCSACLRVGQVIRCSSVNLEFLVDAEDCGRRGIESLIAAPIHHAGSVAGALELYYAEPQSFAEPDVHACQLMAGLAGEVLARSEGQASKKSLQAERAAMRDALEKLKPNLEALVEKPAAPPPARGSTPGIPSGLRADVPVSHCVTCGSELLDEEVFCGKCGMPRGSEHETSSMQSKVALLWQMQEQKNRTAVRNSTNDASNGNYPGPDALTPEDLCETSMPELSELLPPLAKLTGAEACAHTDHDSAGPNPHFADHARQENPQISAAEEVSFQPLAGTAITGAIPRPNWTSAAAAREFLERVAHDDRSHAAIRFLKARRGDVYLALAIVLVACVIRWGVWSEPVTASPTAPVTTSRHSAYADMSLFDRMLIKLGLADPPDPPVSKGNPKTQVWIDEQSALYYCPGADLYGKTPKGRLTSQRDAQLDQYEPALRKACD